ncbi:MAG: hypothetical protein NUW37_03090 [Planctomycetes bacterium]|nr:hypothetical protein [Planctomycetota bacterium]
MPDKTAVNNDQVKKDELFGRIAKERGLVTQDQISECLKVQQMNMKGGKYFRLGIIMVKKGYLNLDQAKDILRDQETAVMEDPSTGARFNVTNFDEKKEYIHPETGEALQPASPGALGVDGSLDGNRDFEEREEESAEDEEEVEVEDDDEEDENLAPVVSDEDEEDGSTIEGEGEALSEAHANVDDDEDLEIADDDDEDGDDEPAPLVIAEKDDEEGIHEPGVEEVSSIHEDEEDLEVEDDEEEVVVSDEDEVVVSDEEDEEEEDEEEVEIASDEDEEEEEEEDEEEDRDDADEVVATALLEDEVAFDNVIDDEAGEPEVEDDIVLGEPGEATEAVLVADDEYGGPVIEALTPRSSALDDVVEEPTKDDVTWEEDEAARTKLDVKDFIGKEVGGCLLEIDNGTVGGALSFLGTHRLLEKPVQIDVASLSADARDRAHEALRNLLRQQRELRTKGEATHLQRIIDFGSDREVFFVIRDRVSRENLDEHVKGGKRFDSDDALKATENLAYGFIRAKQLGFKVSKVSCADGRVDNEQSVVFSGVDYTSTNSHDEVDQEQIIKQLGRTGAKLVMGEVILPESEETFIEMMRKQGASLRVADLFAQMTYEDPEYPLDTFEDLFEAFRETDGLVIEEHRDDGEGETGAAPKVASAPVVPNEDSEALERERLETEEVADGSDWQPDDEARAASAKASDAAMASVGAHSADSLWKSPSEYVGLFKNDHDGAKQSRTFAVVVFVVIAVLIIVLLVIAQNRGDESKENSSSEPGTLPTPQQPGPSGNTNPPSELIGSEQVLSGTANPAIAGNEGTLDDVDVARQNFEFSRDMGDVRGMFDALSTLLPENDPRVREMRDSFGASLTREPTSVATSEELRNLLAEYDRYCDSGETQLEFDLAIETLKELNDKYPQHPEVIERNRIFVETVYDIQRNQGGN